jgi:flotillin
VANAVKFQEIGTKEAERDRAVRIAELAKEKNTGEKTAAFQQEALVKEAERQMRISVAEANAKAVTGENKAKAEGAQANAGLRVTEAEAYQLAETRQREADAAVRRAQYMAEAKAAEALAAKIEAEKRAEMEAVAKATKAKVIVDAEAEAERRRIEAIGEASAIFAKLEAQAKGQYEILAKKGEGLKLIVEGCGGSQAAFQMLMLEHLDQLSQTAAAAISNIKFDKVIVWDGGQASGGGTAGFLQNLARSLPPMLNIMKDVGGVEMPDYFGKLVQDGATGTKDGTAGTKDGTPTQAPEKEKKTPGAPKA